MRIVRRAIVAPPFRNVANAMASAQIERQLAFSGTKHMFYSLREIIPQYIRVYKPEPPIYGVGQMFFPGMGNTLLEPTAPMCDQKRIVDGVLRNVGSVVFRCSFGKLRTGSCPGVYCW